MKRLGFVFCLLMLLGLTAPSASANGVVFNLFEYKFNLDGTIFTSGSGVNLGLFDTSTGLGSITATVSGSGSHSFLGFFDHEIDEETNTFFNEVGSDNGAPAAGQSWEIDEPGYVFGDIYGNFEAGSLDNAVGTTDPEDVSMAMGWDFTLDSDDVASIKFYLSTALPVGAAPPSFYLEQFDPDSQASIYLWSDASIKDGGGPVIPEPSTIVLVLSGLGLAAVGIRFRKRN